MKKSLKNLILLALVSVVVAGCVTQEVSINKKLFHDKKSKEVVVRDQFYVFQDTQIKDKNGNTADIYVGAPIKILSEQDKNTEVEVNGYLVDGVLYSTPAKDFEFAKLNDGFTTTQNGEMTTIVGTLSRDILSNDPLDVWGEQEEFYYEMCTQCHAGHKITSHSKLEWSAILETMKLFSKLDDAESSYILRYLKANANDGIMNAKKEEPKIENAEK